MPRRTPWPDETVHREIERRLSETISDEKLREAALEWVKNRELAYRALEGLIGNAELKKLLKDALKRKA